MTMTMERNDSPSQFATKAHDDWMEKSGTYPQPLSIQSGAGPQPPDANVDLDQSGWLAEGFLCVHAVHRWNQSRRPAFEGSGHSARSREGAQCPKS
jgi:hypothetical protein